MMYTFGSLFTGIAGIDLAAQAAGFEIAWQVENDPFCIAVLEYHYPTVARLAGVRDARQHNLARVDVIGGGFPCQDISAAGRGAGILAGARSGLWREFARIIGELRPRIVFIENVPAITTRDGVIVISDLAALGYDAKWGCIRAEDAGAPHRRERWFCVAYAASTERQTRQRDGMGDNESAVGLPSACSGGTLADSTSPRFSQRGSTGQPTSAAETSGGLDAESERCSSMADPLSAGLEIGGSITGDSGTQRPPVERGGIMADTEGGERYNVRWQRSSGDASGDGIREESRPTQPGMGGAVDGFSRWLDGHTVFPAGPGQEQYDWEAPRTASHQPNRARRLHALGNAVVPVVVYPLMAMIREMLDSSIMS
jgi:DNA (cytosine-5)-methyltransferase 1